LGLAITQFSFRLHPLAKGFIGMDDDNFMNFQIKSWVILHGEVKEGRAKQRQR
jgi:hypothetical protein